MVIPAARLKFYRRVKALTALADTVESGAERLVNAVLYAWQMSSFPKLAPDRAPWGSAKFLAASAVHEFVEWLEARPFNEAAYWLATAYASWIGTELREKRALFFTPPRLAERVISNLVRHGACLRNHHWHDPACGGAAFLVPIVQRMAQQLRKTNLTPRKTLDRIAQHVSGNDVDPVLLLISKSFLEMSLYSLISKAGFKPEFRLFRGDGLTSKTIEALRPDVLACNPPYRKLSSNEATRYRPLHSHVITGQPNLYGLFINRALQLVCPGGLVGLLTPTSFLSGQSFSKLRTTLLSESEMLQVDILSDRTSTFIDVEQETAITTLRTHEPKRTASSHTRVSVLGSEGQFTDLGQYVLPNSGRPWSIPRATGDAEVLRLAESAQFRFSDYGYVPKVGHLVAYRDKRRRYTKLPDSNRRQIVVPLVSATDIHTCGRFQHGRPSRYKRTTSYVHVKSLRQAGVLTKAVVLLQRLTSTEQRSRLVAAAVPKNWVKTHGGFVCENHVIILEPTRKSAFPTRYLAAMLNTRSIDRVFRAISGATNVSISELNELLLPDPQVVQREVDKGVPIEDAVDIGYKTAQRTRMRNGGLSKQILRSAQRS